MAAVAIDTHRVYRLWIDGEAVQGSKGTYEVVNPATEEVVGAAPEASADDSLAAAGLHRAASIIWPG